MKANNVFEFVVQNLGLLKHIPGLPHIFDGYLRLWTYCRHADLLDYFDHLEDEFLSWDNTSVSIHKYGGLQFNVGDREVGHLHSNGLLDVALNRQVKEMLSVEGRVNDHHLFKKSGWISFYMRSHDDEAYAIKLLQLGYALKNRTVSS